jgi:Ca2+-binding EF-hand superfamily protein
MIKYKEFEKIILDFQLISHREFLSKFITLFRQFDTNSFGYITEEQFREMMHLIDPEQRLNIEEILQAIDPQEMGYFPFSACVSIFSRLPMTEDSEGITTIMHYISGENV